MRAGLALLLGLALVFPAASAHDWTARKPAYTRGDFWRYDLNSTEGALFALNGTLLVTMEGTRTHVVNGTAVDAVAMVFTGNGTLDWAPEAGEGAEPIAGTWEIQGLELWEVSQLKIVHRYSRVVGDATTETTQQRLTFENVNYTDHVVLEDTWRFPLPDHGEGAVRANVTFAGWTNGTFPGAPPPFDNFRFNESGAYEETANVSADGLQHDFEVPAGRWDVLVVNESLATGGWTAHYYAREIGADARTETFNETGALVSRLDLVAYRYRAGTSIITDDFSMTTTYLVLAAALAASVAVTVLVLRRRRRRGVEWKSFEEELREKAAEGDEVSKGP